MKREVYFKHSESIHCLFYDSWLLLNLRSSLLLCGLYLSTLWRIQSDKSNNRGYTIIDGICWWDLPLTCCLFTRPTQGWKRSSLLIALDLMVLIVGLQVHHLMTSKSGSNIPIDVSHDTKSLIWRPQTLKGIAHPNMKILSVLSFFCGTQVTGGYFSLFVHTTKDNGVQCCFHFHCIDKNIFKKYYFLFHRGKS